MKVARITNDGTLMLKGEVIEYPAELEGKRNLFSVEFYRDINNYDGVSLYRYHLTNLESNKRYAIRSWLKEGEVAESGFYLTLSIGHPNPNSVGTVGGTAGHIIQNGNTRNASTYTREDMPVYISYYRANTDPSVLDKYHISIQQLDSGNISEWTPAPEDLGLEYSSDIQNFTTGFRNNGDLFVCELVEKVIPLPPEDEIWIYGTFTTTYEIGQLLGNYGSNATVVDFYYDDDHYVIKASGTNLGERFCSAFNTNGNTVIFGSQFLLRAAFHVAPKATFIILSNTVAIRTQNHYMQAKKIYVLDNLVETYKAQTSAMAFIGEVLPLSNYTTVMPRITSDGTLLVGELIENSNLE